jgi:hypothetical protein
MNNNYSLLHKFENQNFGNDWGLFIDIEVCNLKYDINNNNSNHNSNKINKNKFYLYSISLFVVYYF